MIALAHSSTKIWHKPSVGSWSWCSNKLFSAFQFPLRTIFSGLQTRSHFIPEPNVICRLRRKSWLSTLELLRVGGRAAGPHSVSQARTVIPGNSVESCSVLTVFSQLDSELKTMTSSHRPWLTDSGLNLKDVKSWAGHWQAGPSSGCHGRKTMFKGSQCSREDSFAGSRHSFRACLRAGPPLPTDIRIECSAETPAPGPGPFSAAFKFSVAAEEELYTESSIYFLLVPQAR